MMKKSLKAVSFFTLACFVSTQFFSPAQGWGAAALSSQSEVRAFLPDVLQIPEDLGHLETAVSNPGPALIHIQTAHGNYEAQEKIRGLLHYLKKTYGIKTLFIEGSVSELEPDRLRFFPEDMPLTMKIADDLTKKAYVKGAELFLLEEKNAGAYGIENAEIYNDGGKAFLEVLTQQKKSGDFVRAADTQIDRLEGVLLNKDLRAFLKRLEDYESDRLPVLDWFSWLKTEAVKRLEMDLADPAWQIDWPMLVRLFKLQEIEKKIDLPGYQKERGEFLKAIGRFVPGLSPQIETMLSPSFFHQSLPYPQTEILFEKMVSALPPNFNYEVYPNVKLFIGHLILQSEIKADLLLLETEALAGKIADKLAAAPDEKKILSLLKNYRLLQKLFRLELTPREHKTILSFPRRRESKNGSPTKAFRDDSNAIKPSLLITQFISLNSAKRVKDIRFEHLEEIDLLFDKALEYYRFVKERDPHMIENIEKRMKEKGIEKAVVVTGGFHSQPFTDYFTEKGYRYALVSPKITTTDGREAYVDSALKMGFDLESATTETMSLMDPAVKLGEPVKKDILQIITRSLPAGRNLPFSPFGARSEARVLNRPPDWSQDLYRAVRIGGAFSEEGQAARKVESQRVPLERLRTIAISQINFRVKDDAGVYRLQVFNGKEWKLVPRAELKENQPVWIGRVHFAPDDPVASDKKERTLGFSLLDTDPNRTVGSRIAVSWEEKDARIVLHLGPDLLGPDLTDRAVSRMMTETDAKIPAGDRKTEDGKRIPLEESVRLSHLELKRLGREILITDNGSRTGTFYEKKIEHSLTDGQSTSPAGKRGELTVNWNLTPAETVALFPGTEPLVIRPQEPFEVFTMAGIQVQAKEVLQFRDGKLFQQNPKAPQSQTERPFGPGEGDWYSISKEGERALQISADGSRVVYVRQPRSEARTGLTEKTIGEEKKEIQAIVNEVKEIMEGLNRLEGTPQSLMPGHLTPIAGERLGRNPNDFLNEDIFNFRAVLLHGLSSWLLYYLEPILENAFEPEANWKILQRFKEDLALYTDILEEFLKGSPNEYRQISLDFGKRNAANYFLSRNVGGILESAKKGQFLPVHADEIRALQKRFLEIEKNIRRFMKQRQPDSRADTRSAEVELPEEQQKFKTWKQREAEIERPLLEWALTQSGGHLQDAGNFLALNRNTITSKMKKYKLTAETYAGPAADPKPDSRDFKKIVEEALLQAIEEALVVTDGKKSQAADLLEINRNHMLFKDAKIPEKSLQPPPEEPPPVQQEEKSPPHLRPWSQREEEWEKQLVLAALPKAVFSNGNYNNNELARLLGVSGATARNLYGKYKDEKVSPFSAQFNGHKEPVSLETFKRLYVISALILYQGENLGTLIGKMGLDRVTLRRWLADLGIERESFENRSLTELVMENREAIGLVFSESEKQGLYEKILAEIPKGKERTDTSEGRERILRAVEALGQNFVFSIRSEFELEKFAPEAQEVENVRREKISLLSSSDLVTRVAELKKEISGRKENLEKFLPEAFAIFKDTVRRQTGMELSLQQVLAALAIHRGRAVEMKPSEGKTLSIALAAFANALLGKGVHIHTFNDYLAKRDAEITAPLFSFLGLTVAGRSDNETTYLFDPVSQQLVRPPGMKNKESKQKAYLSDIVYGSKEQFVFDFLNDQMLYDKNDQVQRPEAPALVVVDEGDSVLLDEAANPLVAGVEAPAMNRERFSEELYLEVYKFADGLSEGEGKDYTSDNFNEDVQLNPLIFKERKQELKEINLRREELENLIHQALIVKHFYKRNSEYALKDGKVIIVDEFTGRLKINHVLANHKHQLIAAKEILRAGSQNAVKVQRPIHSHNVITYQNYYRMMGERSIFSMITGTLGDEAPEIHEVYGLDFVSIPLQFKSLMRENAPVITRTKKEKDERIIEKIREIHARGNPVLVFVRRISDVENLKKELLSRAGIHAATLDGLTLDDEAKVLFEAGEKDQVTIVTNVAGRGVNVKISDEVKALGGLNVILTKLHTSRRIDDQQELRAARRDEPGESYMFLSLEDESFQRFGGLELSDSDHAKNKADFEELRRKIQENGETFLRAMRERTFAFDKALDPHRKDFYARRGQILDLAMGMGLKERVQILKSVDHLWWKYLAKLEANKYRADINYRQESDELFRPIARALEAVTAQLSLPPQPVAGVSIAPDRSETRTGLTEKTPVYEELRLALAGDAQTFAEAVGALRRRLEAKGTNPDLISRWLFEAILDPSGVPDSGSLQEIKNLLNSLEGGPVTEGEASADWQWAKRVVRNFGIGETVFITPEMTPVSQGGGLGMVMKGLPRGLADAGIPASVFTILYQDETKNHRSAEVLLRDGIELDGEVFYPVKLDSVSVPVGGVKDPGSNQYLESPRDVEMDVYLVNWKGVKIYFMHQVQAFNKLYPGPVNHSAVPEMTQSVLLSRGSLELMKREGIQPTTVFANDWMAAPALAYLRTHPKYNQDPFFKNTRLGMAIHNQAYQGVQLTNEKIPGQPLRDIFPLFGLDGDHYDGLSHPGDKNYLNLLRGGIFHSDFVLTVSPDYAEDIKKPEFGEGLHEFILAKGEHVHGISNGIEEERIRGIYQRIGHGITAPQAGAVKVDEKEYLEELLSLKDKTKTTIQKKYGLNEDPQAVIVSFVGRIAEQKGIRLIGEKARQMLDENPEVQLLVGGPVAKGDKEAEEFERVIKELLADPKYKGRVAGAFGFVNQIPDAFMIYLASDIFLMPSRFEPGGLTQLESQVGGTVVVGRQVQGIAATLVDYDKDAEHGTAFLFKDYEGEALYSAFKRALKAIETPAAREKLVLHAASAQNDWSERVPSYRKMLQGELGIPDLAVQAHGEPARSEVRVAGERPDTEPGTHPQVRAEASHLERFYEEDVQLLMGRSVQALLDTKPEDFSKAIEELKEKHGIAGRVIRIKDDLRVMGMPSDLIVHRPKIWETLQTELNNTGQQHYLEFETTAFWAVLDTIFKDSLVLVFAQNGTPTKVGALTDIHFVALPRSDAQNWPDWSGPKSFFKHWLDLRGNISDRKGTILEPVRQFSGEVQGIEDGLFREMESLEKRFSASAGSGAAIRLLASPMASEGLIVIKAARGPDGEKLSREYEWMRNLPEDVKKRFPQIFLGGRPPETDLFFYFMDRIKADSAADLLWKGEVEPEKALDYWTKSFQAFQGHREESQKEVPPGWERKNGIDKVADRFEQLGQRHSGAFTDFLSSERLKIDGVSYLNMKQVIERIKALVDVDRFGLLRPLLLMLIHGDLHLGNILAKDEGIMIDPRGDPTGDSLYEWVKLVHGLDFEYLKKLALQLEPETSGTAGEPAFRFRLADQQPLADQAYAGLFGKMDEKMVREAAEYKALFGEHWQLRFWYEYAALMATPIFFADKFAENKKPEDLQKAKTFYGLGVVYLNRFLNLYVQELEKQGVSIGDQLKEDLSAEVFRLNQPLSGQLITLQKMAARSEARQVPADLAVQAHGEPARSEARTENAGKDDWGRQTLMDQANQFFNWRNRDQEPGGAILKRSIGSDYDVTVAIYPEGWEINV